MILNCIIVDDEPIARDILRRYIMQLPYLKLVAECSNATEAMQFITSHPADVVILDINMPGLGGLDMLRTLHKYPAVIITSAYAQYALDGFELSVTDYLLKPVSFSRFVKAVEKVAAQNKNEAHTNGLGETDQFVMVKSDRRFTRILFDQITYIEASGNYIVIYCGNERVMTKQTLSQFEDILPEGRFIRIHKSYIVSMKAVRYIEGNEISIGEKRLPVGKVYKKPVHKKLAI
ncbi:MAG TPA: response regulator transcription factor [Chitinophagaceae bacterium]|nr:response regulator transcription factor [Chitinophagaceae bacterium]